MSESRTKWACGGCYATNSRGLLVGTTEGLVKYVPAAAASPGLVKCDFCGLSVQCRAIAFIPAAAGQGGKS